MAVGYQIFREQYSNLSISELKKEYKKENSFFNKLLCRIYDLINKTDDNSNVGNNKMCLVVLEELIKEKEKELK